jgi:uncharacterized damage-inducible protein DinB
MMAHGDSRRLMGKRSTQFHVIRFSQALHHGTEHRSQICTAFTTLGIEPPWIDPYMVEAAQLWLNTANRRALERSLA